MRKVGVAIMIKYTDGNDHRSCNLLRSVPYSLQVLELDLQLIIIWGVIVAYLEHVKPLNHHELPGVDAVLDDIWRDYGQDHSICSDCFFQDSFNNTLSDSSVGSQAL